MEKETLSKRNRILIFLGVLLFIFALFASNATDGDTLFHIKLGEHIINNGLPTKDMFSIHDNLNYIAYAYGFEVLVYFIYNLFNFSGLLIFRYLFLLAFVLTSTFIIHDLNKSNSWLKSLVISGIALLSITMFTAIRPQMFSYFILLVQLYIVNKWFQNKDGKMLWLIPITFLILNVFHGGVYVFHGGIMAVFTLAFFVSFDGKLHFHNAFKDKYFYKFMLIMFISACTILVHPYFPDIVFYGLRTVGDSTMMMITEWHPPTVRKIILVLLATLFTFKYVDMKKVPIERTLIFILCSILTIDATRFTPYMMISLMFILLEADFPKLKMPKFITKKTQTTDDKNLACICFAIFCLIFFSYQTFLIPGNHQFIFNEERYPVETVNYIKENNISGRIYNDYNEGAYLLFNDIPVFIDPRCDLYSSTYNPGIDVLEDSIFVQKNISVYQIAEKYDLQYAILKKSTYKVWLSENKDLYSTLHEDKNFILIEWVK